MKGSSATALNRPNAEYGTNKMIQDDHLPQIIVTNQYSSNNDDPTMSFFPSYHSHIPNQQQQQQQERLLEDLVDEIDQPAGNANDDEDAEECCNQHPIVELCQNCRCCLPNSLLRSCLQGEHLQRAFCLGAIDGMLTGSGITAACVGMGVFHHLWDTLFNAQLHLHQQQRWMVVALSLAACASDGICMGISHICSSALLRDQGYKDRHKEEWMFDHFRNISKARMVDALMQRGMLKIDASSIADTLEGYPDIFINALAGEAQGLGPLGIAEDSIDHVVVNTSAKYSSSFSRNYNDYTDDDIDNVYNCCCSSSSYCIPEFWSEGILMMISFSLFSLLPSILYGFVLAVPTEGKEEEIMRSTGISRESLAVSTLSLIIFGLGTWKTKFFHGGNYLLFGLEAVVLLLISIFSAYGIGFFFITYVILEES